MLRVVYRPPSMALATLALASCAVGPNFKPPPPPATTSYIHEQAALSQRLSGSSVQRQTLHVGEDLPGDWWKAFGSSSLDTLIVRAMRSYPALEAQQAALRAAQQDLRASQGIFFPQLQGQGAAVRQSELGSSVGIGLPSLITNVFQATVNVSYTFDIFGGERRNVEAMRARAEQQQFQLEASYLTLTSNVVASAIQFASTREQLVVTDDIIDLETRQLRVIKRQFDLGSRARADVLQQESNLAAVRATRPALQQQCAVYEHELAVLTGQLPSDAKPMDLRLADLKLPGDLPVALPSALLIRRPDVRAQQAVLHQASAEVGVATANMLPQVTLTGYAGTESFRYLNLVQSGRIWELAAGLAQPLFEGGTLLARRRSAVAQYDEAAANYRQVVLNAFENVADVLTALDNDAAAMQANDDSAVAAKTSLDLIQQQYADGAASYESLLAAEQSYQRARIDQVRALAARFVDTVNLFQALGGGWWHRAHLGAVAP